MFPFYKHSEINHFGNLNIHDDLYYNPIVKSKIYKYHCH